MSFTGKSIIVTGATSGIGRAAAEGFVRAGASVVAVGRNDAALRELAASLSGAGGRVHTVRADVTEQGSPDLIVRAAVDTFGGLDVLVNAAGIIATGTLDATTDELWDSMMGINLRAPFRLMRAASPHLAARKGAVVNVSSVTGPRSFPGVLAYCVSKAGVDHLTRGAALELAAPGGRVNAVSPGVVVTGLHRSGGMSDEAYSAFLEHSKSTHPLGRVGEADEVANLI